MSIYSAFVFLFAGWAFSAGANITVVQPKAENHVPVAKGKDGDTSTLMPDPIIYLGAGSKNATSLKERLETEYPANSGWTFNLGAALNGTMTIDHYLAKVPSEHVLGSEIDARYTRGNGDPALATLRWVQIVNTTYTDSPFIDGLKPPDNLPFYYDEKTHGLLSGNRIPNPSGQYDLWFADDPNQDCRKHPDSWTARFDTFLVGYVPKPGSEVGTVTIYDGFRWGYNATCVPTPEGGSSLLFLGTALFGLSLLRPLAPTTRSNPAQFFRRARMTS